MIREKESKAIDEGIFIQHTNTHTQCMEIENNSMVTYTFSVNVPTNVPVIYHLAANDDAYILWSVKFI